MTCYLGGFKVWKSSRRLWTTVLWPLEFVNLPSKVAMDAMIFACFASVFRPTGTALYHTLFWRYLHSTYSSLTVKSSIWQSYCSLNAFIPKWVTLFLQTRRRSERGFCKLIASSRGAIAQSDDLLMVHFDLACFQGLSSLNPFSLRTAWRQLH